jgi:ectoine hydroxylase-related dioxygenase (phytanoyl-CoA dioxygenase family)
VAGEQIATLWLALDNVTSATGAVEYLKGSHRWGQKFLAVSFNPDEKYTENLPEVPDIEAERDQHDIVSFDLAPGDCTIHHAATLHHAPGNTSSDTRRRAYIQRWAGDDVVYNPRPNLMAIKSDPGIAAGATLDCDLFPVAWRRNRDAA